MKKKKTVLIFTANMGQGHITASNSIRDAIEDKYSGEFEIEIVDGFKLAGRKFSEIMQFLYLDVFAKYANTAYKLYFAGTDTKNSSKGIGYLAYLLFSEKGEKCLKEVQPDLVVLTFPFYDFILKKLTIKLGMNVPIITVITDSITIHNSWLLGDSDYYVVANEDSAKVLRENKIKRKKIKVMGFPLSLTFVNKFNKHNYIKEIGLEEGKDTWLYLPGSATTIKTAENVLKDLLSLNDRCQGVVVCGKNEKMKHRLDFLLKGENIKIFGWTKDVPKLMQITKVVITKAGGASVMEAVAAKSPMIITKVIPGQEEGNAELIKKYQIGLILDKKECCSKAVETILDNYSEYIKGFEKRLNDPGASLKIASFIKDMINR